MMSRELPYPLFDADNHLYETEEAFLKSLPKAYAGAIQYVQIKGRTKIAIRGQISEYIPNPTFEVVARPGAMEEYFAHGNPEGKSRRGFLGRADTLDPRLPRARAAHAAHGRAGDRADADVPDAGQPP